jgi:hypothetical protein
MSRHRFQFRLRTLLIGVTLLGAVGGLLGREWQIVRERASEIRWLEERGPLPPFAKSEPCYPYYQGGNNRWEITINDAELPWHRRLLGDHLLQEIVYPTTAAEVDRNRVKAAFPEANIHAYFPD